MALPDFLTDPRALAVLTALMYALVRYQRGLSWYDYRALHRLKCLVSPVLDRYQSTYFVLSKKGYRDDAEYYGTVEGSVRGVWRQLRNAGGSPHLINSVKQRPLPDGSTQLSAAHVVWFHGDEDQTEVYLFSNPGVDTVDVYVHHETSVTDPAGHLSDPQTDGDPDDVLAGVLEVR